VTSLTGDWVLVIDDWVLALTPSPSPIGWERVAAGRVRVRCMGSFNLFMHANWDYELKALETQQTTKRPRFATWPQPKV